MKLLEFIIFLSWWWSYVWSLYSYVWKYKQHPGRNRRTIDWIASVTRCKSFIIWDSKQHFVIHVSPQLVFYVPRTMLHFYFGLDVNTSLLCLSSTLVLYFTGVKNMQTVDTTMLIFSIEFLLCLGKSNATLFLSVNSSDYFFQVF